MTRPKPNEHVGHNATHTTYAITCDEFEHLVRRAEGRCDRCGVKSRRLVIDHDHALGQRAVRGLLCGRCNIILGKVDRGDWLLDGLTATYHLSPFHRSIPATCAPRVRRPRSPDLTRRAFRYEDDERWHLFMRLAEPEGAASEVLRQFVDWYTRKPKSKTPRRPPPSGSPPTAEQ